MRDNPRNPENNSNVLRLVMLVFAFCSSRAVKPSVHPSDTVSAPSDRCTAAYLIERGGTRIGMIAGHEGPSSTRDRVRGFKDRLKSQGLRTDLIGTVYSRSARRFACSATHAHPVRTAVTPTMDSTDDPVLASSVLFVAVCAVLT